MTELPDRGTRSPAIAALLLSRLRGAGGTGTLARASAVRCDLSGDAGATL